MWCRQRPSCGLARSFDIGPSLIIDYYDGGPFCINSYLRDAWCHVSRILESALNIPMVGPPTGATSWVHGTTRTQHARPAETRVLPFRGTIIPAGGPQLKVLNFGAMSIRPHSCPERLAALHAAARAPAPPSDAK